MLTQLYTRSVSCLAQLKSKKNGQTLVEYGLILALVAIVVVAILSALGGQLQNLFSKVTSSLT